MPRRKNTFKITGPKIKVTKKGLKVTKPRGSVGNKVRLNLSSKGVSGSVKTPLGTYNTRKDIGRKATGCPLAVLPLLLFIIAIASVIAAL